MRWEYVSWLAAPPSFMRKLSRWDGLDIYWNADWRLGTGKLQAAILRTEVEDLYFEQKLNICIKDRMISI